MLLVTGFGKERPLYAVRYNEGGTRNSSAMVSHRSRFTVGGLCGRLEIFVGNT